LKKPFYLFLALLLPIGIFLFLKFAGRNEFNIPIYYEDGVDAPETGCAQTYSKPYVLSPIEPINKRDWLAANVLVFGQENVDVGKLKTALHDEFDRAEVRVEAADSLPGGKTAAGFWRRCLFFARPPYQTVLFDRAGRIRGYYDVSLREEVDRLRVELKILLKKY
jgi:protein SCO1/2